MYLSVKSSRENKTILHLMFTSFSHQRTEMRPFLSFILLFICLWHACIKNDPSVDVTSKNTIFVPKKYFLYFSDIIYNIITQTKTINHLT